MGWMERSRGRFWVRGVPDWLRWRCSMAATYAHSVSWRGHGVAMQCANASGAVGVSEASRHFLEASMAAGSAKEVREGMTGVKRAAEWDPPQRCGKNPRQVFC